MLILCTFEKKIFMNDILLPLYLLYSVLDIAYPIPIIVSIILFLVIAVIFI